MNDGAPLEMDPREVTARSLGIGPEAIPNMDEALPHWCADSHTAIQFHHSDDDERCPLCRTLDALPSGEATAEKRQPVCPTCGDHFDEEALCWACLDTERAIHAEQIAALREPTPQASDPLRALVREWQEAQQADLEGYTVATSKRYMAAIITLTHFDLSAAPGDGERKNRKSFIKPEVDESDFLDTTFEDSDK